MKHAWGQVTDAALLALKEMGRGTSRDIADACGLAVEDVRKTCWRMSKAPRDSRRLHVVDWVSKVEGQREYPRAVFAPGPGRNAPKPAPVTHTEASRNYLRRCQLLATTMTHAPYMPQKEAGRYVARLRKSASI